MSFFQKVKETWASFLLKTTISVALARIFIHTFPSVYVSVNQWDHTVLKSLQPVFLYLLKFILSILSHLYVKKFIPFFFITI